MRLIDQAVDRTGRYKLVTDCADPLALVDVQHYLNADCDGDDDLIEGFITAARGMVESKTNWKLGEATIDFIFTRFHREMLCEAMVGSIVSIKYYDQENDIQTLAAADYESSLTEFPATVKILAIPATYSRLDAVTIQIKTTTAYPKPLLVAMKLIIGHWYENRQDVVTGHSANEIPETSNAICNVYKLSVLR